ncbi:MAG TPA: MoxR family ATPase [Caulobacteraceae bacterium]|jgi:MoxR-like ATPase|nr:MoxR family ATPase [Caulobacteraceae bacterium]
MEPAREASNDTVAAFERASEALGRARAALRGVVFGQDKAVDLGLAALVAGGWAMLAGGPGSAKTWLAEGLARVAGLSFGRLPFARDLDLAAATRPVLSVDGRRRSGDPPLFSQLLLADELDRASPAVRASLLEAAHDGTLVVDGRSVALAKPFHLFATGGRDGLAGFDEAEIDRFLLQIDLGAPDRDGERRMLIETAQRRAPTSAAMDAPSLLAAQRIAVELPVGERVVEAMLDLVRRARPDDPSAPAIVRSDVARGPGPRAGQALMRLARATALIDGRPSPSTADVRAVAPAVLSPRLQMVERHGKSADREPVLEALVAGI